jgi:methyltransferase (TIGR00027 family)
MVAAARAVASHRPDRVIEDPFAQPLVKAVGIDALCRLVDADGVDEQADRDPDLSLQPIVDAFAVRTRYFDDFFLAAMSAGIRQAVILASGLDSRAYRLPWPSSSTLYEIDLPAVLDFKIRALARLGVRPIVRHRPVAVDLRDDWPKALQNSGFDDQRPTAWSAEGLLSYMPPDDQDRLFDGITALSAPGSQLATEYRGHEGDEMSQRIISDRRWNAHGVDVNTAELIYPGRRRPVPDYLSASGWSVAVMGRPELCELYGLQRPDENSPMCDVLGVTAALD